MAEIYKVQCYKAYTLIKVQVSRLLNTARLHTKNNHTSKHLYSHQKYQCLHQIHDFHTHLFMRSIQNSLQDPKIL